LGGDQRCFDAVSRAIIPRAPVNFLFVVQVEKTRSSDTIRPMQLREGGALAMIGVLPALRWTGSIACAG